MSETLPEKSQTTVNDLYESKSNGTPSAWEIEVSNADSYLTPSGELNYTRFLNDLGNYGKEEIFGITRYMQERLAFDQNGQRRDFARTEYSDQDVLFMIDGVQNLYLKDSFDDVKNYVLSRPFIISTFNVLRLVPSIILYSTYGQDAETALKIGLDQLIAKTDAEVFWRKEAKSKEGSMLYRTNEGFQRIQGSNPNPSGKITEKEMGKVVLPNVIRILKAVNQTRTVFK
ncbi:hypothetical protein KKA50_01095 [Patescibacteria group bacterium]|nr:hypothetical protein [Patescibacteria group bacterium]